MKAAVVEEKPAKKRQKKQEKTIRKDLIKLVLREKLSCRKEERVYVNA